MRSLPWGELSGRHGESWRRVRELVQAWGKGELEDPCPEALHWGGTTDRPRRYWKAIECGITKNTFYRHRDHFRHRDRHELGDDSMPLASASAP